MKILRFLFYFSMLIILLVTVSCKDDTTNEPVEKTLENQVISSGKTIKKKALEDLILV